MILCSVLNKGMERDILFLGRNWNLMGGKCNMFRPENLSLVFVNTISNLV